MTGHRPIDVAVFARPAVVMRRTTDTRTIITDAGVALSIFRANGTIGLRVVTEVAATVLATIALTVVVVGALNARKLSYKVIADARLAL